MHTDFVGEKNDSKLESFSVLVTSVGKPRSVRSVLHVKYFEQLQSTADVSEASLRKGQCKLQEAVGSKSK